MARNMSHGNGSPVFTSELVTSALSLLVFKKFAVRSRRRTATARLPGRRHWTCTVHSATQERRPAASRTSTRSTSAAQRRRAQSGRRLTRVRRPATARRPKHSGHRWRSRTLRDDSADAGRHRCFDSSTEPCRPAGHHQINIKSNVSDCN